MTNQLTHHAALAHNEDLLRQAAASRRAGALRPRLSHWGPFMRLRPRRRTSTRPAAAASRSSLLRNYS
jgi:hypothetical protein